MSNETPPTPPAKKSRPRSDQDQIIANRITAAREQILLAQGDAEIMTLVAPRGYDQDKLSEGLSLQQAAQQAFSARQEALGAQKQANENFANALVAARQTYTDFREIARSFLTDSTARTALGLNERIPADIQKLTTVARTAYTATLNNSIYLAALSPYGYSQSSLQIILTDLDGLISQNNAQASAQASAARATQQRDEADAVLILWLKQFKTVAKIALRSRSDLIQKLGF
jgi:hypothetical protein